MAIFYNKEKIEGLLEQSEVSSLESLAAKTLSHMIKYKNQPDQQSPSWISTIVRTTLKCEKYGTSIKNKFYNSDISKIYKDTKKDLVHDNVDGYCKKEMLNDKPEWTLKQISDKEFIKNFLYSNAKGVDKELIDRKLKEYKLL